MVNTIQKYGLIQKPLERYKGCIHNGVKKIRSTLSGTAWGDRP